MLTKKHHYYEDPRKLAKDGVTHFERCRLERVRAEKSDLETFQTTG